MDPITAGLIMGGVGSGLDFLGTLMEEDEQPVPTVTNASGTTSSTSSASTTGTETESRKLLDKTKQQKALEKESLAAYGMSKGLADMYATGIQGAEVMQGQARDLYGNLLSGEALRATPEDYAQAEAMRQAQMDMGSQEIQGMLDQRLQQMYGSASQRGVRGGALSQLESQTLAAGAQQQRALSAQANMAYQQQLLDAPYKRMAAQSPFLQTGLSFRDSMVQNAASMYNDLQNPFVLQGDMNARLAQYLGRNKSTSDVKQKEDTTTNSTSTTAPVGSANYMGGASLPGNSGTYTTSSGQTGVTNAAFNTPGSLFYGTQANPTQLTPAPAGTPPRVQPNESGITNPGQASMNIPGSLFSGVTGVAPAPAGPPVTQQNTGPAVIPKFW